MLSALRVLARPALAASLAALCLTAAAPASAQAQSASCEGADMVPTVATMATAKAATLCLLNGERAAAGLPSLRTEATLENVADGYSLAMVLQNVFAHVLPDGRTLTQRLSGYTSGADVWAIGENLAYGESIQATPRATMVAWMNSPGHRVNIMNGGFREVGIGIVSGTPIGSTRPSATYTTDFGSRELPATTPAAAPATSSPSGTSAPTAATTRIKTPKMCTRAAIARLSRSGRRTRTSTCARLRRAAVRRAAVRRAAARAAALRTAAR